MGEFLGLQLLLALCEMDNGDTGENEVVGISYKKIQHI